MGRKHIYHRFTFHCYCHGWPRLGSLQSKENTRSGIAPTQARTLTNVLCLNVASGKRTLLILFGLRSGFHFLLHDLYN
ncbi:hypothetical protein Bpfe_021284, partial [Biomphalaria pfeifferi]